MSLLQSWVPSANSPETDFPLNNLPYGVFSVDGGDFRKGIAIGDMILDVSSLITTQFSFAAQVLSDSRGWNGLMESGPKFWAQFRTELLTILSHNYISAKKLEAHLIPKHIATMHMPFSVSEYTDFYASKHHAFNVGSMFRGPENALPPNWLHIPIGYNGRASSVVVSGTDIIRPKGQLKGPNDMAPSYGASKRFDIELELGAIVGNPSNGPISVDQAFENIFGFVLLNDWSARDIQAWEYQPLGPFQSKATATSISPWIVSKDALEPFRCNTPNREFELLPHLKDTDPMLYDIELGVELSTNDGHNEQISHTNANTLYYSFAQQLAHHTSSGCPMRTGDLLGSGTISGPNKENRGSLLELSWGGKEPITLKNGQTRSFLNDGDKITLIGRSKGDGYNIGFGECMGTLLPAK